MVRLLGWLVGSQVSTIHLKINNETKKGHTGPVLIASQELCVNQACVPEVC